LPGSPADPDGHGRAAVLGGRPAAAHAGRGGRRARRRPRGGGDGAAWRAEPVAAGEPRPGNRLADQHRHHRPARLRLGPGAWHARAAWATMRGWLVISAATGCWGGWS